MTKVTRLINLVLAAVVLLPASVSALSQNQTDVFNSGTYYYDTDASSANCSVDSGQISTATDGSVALLMEAIAIHESGGKIDATNPTSTASGKYQMLDKTWLDLADKYYKPALQFARASDAPEEVQDAVVYLTYGDYSIKQYNAFQIAVIWYGGTGVLNDIANKFNVVPGGGNAETFGDYGNEMVDWIKAGKATDTKYKSYGNKPLSSIPINPQAAPDFNTYLSKLGKPIPTLKVVNYGSDGKPIDSTSADLSGAAGSSGTSTCANCSANTTPTGQPATPSNLDIGAIANKYGLQSAIVKQIGGSVIGAFNADKPPAQPASVMKLIFANIFLNTKPDLDKQVTIRANEVYGPGDSYHAGQTITLREALRATFEESQNTTANVMLDAAGVKPGPTATAAARALGYNNTTINDYYNSGGGTNSSTAADLTKAMEDIYTAAGGKFSGSNYADAYGYLHQDSVSGVHFGINSEANKWGWVSDVTGNDAVIAVGSSKYIVTVYVPQGSSDETSPAATQVKQSTNEIINALGGVTATGTGVSTDCTGTAAGSFVFYQQCDSQWGDHQIYSKGDRTLCSSGCGPTSAAMVIATLANQKITPVNTGDYMTSLGQGVGFIDAGATTDGLTRAVEHWGLKAQSIGVDFGAAANIIKAGGLVIAGGQGDPPFSKGGHVVVLRGLDDKGNFLIGNPSLGLNDGSNDTTYTTADLRAGVIYMIGVTK